MPRRCGRPARSRMLSPVVAQNKVDHRCVAPCVAFPGIVQLLFFASQRLEFHTAPKYSLPGEDQAVCLQVPNFANWLMRLGKHYHNGTRSRTDLEQEIDKHY